MKKKISRRVAIIRLLILEVKPLLVVLFLLGKHTLNCQNMATLIKIFPLSGYFLTGAVYYIYPNLYAVQSLPNCMPAQT